MPTISININFPTMAATRRPSAQVTHKSDYYVFSDFFDLSILICGKWIFMDFMSLTFWGFSDLGNCPLPGISNFGVIYTIGSNIPAKNARTRNCGHAKVPKWPETTKIHRKPSNTIKICLICLVIRFVGYLLYWNNISVHIWSALQRSKSITR